MRPGFSLMLVVSLALHGVVAAGIALTHFHVTSASTLASTDGKAITLILLRSEETPDFQQPLAAPSILNPIRSKVSTALSSPAQPVVEKIIPTPTITPPPSLALEANPNAHVRALPPEAVLSPSPAPHLDGKNGVVFLLDISGSMYEPYAGSTRLAFARQVLAQRIKALKDGTPFAIAIYAQTARTSGPLVAASNATREAAIRYVMQDVDCGGGTNLPAGLESAAQLQAGTIMLASDGDLNISQFNLMAKARDILGPEGQCPKLVIIGIGPRPNTTARQLLQGLADQQGGTYCAEQFEGDAHLLTAASEKP